MVEHALDHVKAALTDRAAHCEAAARAVLALVPLRLSNRNGVADEGDGFHLRDALFEVHSLQEALQLLRRGGRMEGAHDISGVLLVYTAPHVNEIREVTLVCKQQQPSCVLVQAPNGKQVRGDGRLRQETGVVMDVCDKNNCC